MLYRIDREFDEYKGAGEYETKEYAEEELNDEEPV